ncbi:MAG TPA: hypothetical protein VGY99_19265 [Candidatus Binataceae bacterium]|jgi:hypothetical protein|nr:hypothetical protein [Candidatus Binataceae bacterium]
MEETLTPAVIEQWLTARNRLLDSRRPIDVLAQEDAKAVLEAALAYVEGAYV